MVVLAFLALLCLWGTALHAQTAGESAPTGPYTLTEFDGPFTFSYHISEWADKVRIADGHAVLHDISPHGAAGVKAKLDLTAYANWTPVLRLRTTTANTTKAMQFKFIDADNRIGNWRYPLPDPSSDFVTVMPMGSMPISQPNRLTRNDAPDSGPLDLAHIIQYRLDGDWTAKKLDVEIDSILLLPPDEKALADRQAYAKVLEAEAVERAKKEEAEKARLAAERVEKVRRYTPRSEQSPEIVHVSLVAPEILSLTIEAQHVVPATLTKYEPQPGDDIKKEIRPDGTVRRAQLRRNKALIGNLQGKNLDWLGTLERLEGDPLLEFQCDDVANYTIRSNDDPNFTQPVRPVAVYRKSVPIDLALNTTSFATRHRVYLKLPSKIEPGKDYVVTVDKVNVKNAELTFRANLESVRSESVHVNQIGYRPGDTPKRAFLSVWLGSGGAWEFSDGLTFSLLEDATGKPVFTGKVERVLAVDGKEELWYKPAKNYNNTAVYRMEFSEFATPGIYRVFVPGIGCSYPFEIGSGVWEKAFLTQMKGVYKQRSGVEVGPPYSEFHKPRDFHPDDGVSVTRSTYDVSATGPRATDAMAKGDTGKVVKDAWGGYHDAGDWNPRRVTHMGLTMAQLELCEMFPQYFNALRLSIPQEAGVPDMLTEALFEIDCFKRLQLPNGAIPYGIETVGDPSAGEVSWLSTDKAYVLAPTIRDSWYYAAVAARAAKLLRPFKPEMAQSYQDSAAKAFAWAEAEFPKHADKKLAEIWEALDARNLSAVLLYDLTGENSYHDIFKQTTALRDPNADLYQWGKNIQSDAAFFYARLDDIKADRDMKSRARAGIVRLAENSLKYGDGNAFNLTNAERGRPMFAGFFSTSGGKELVRAHYLTGNAKYLQGVVQSCQFQSGCNPNNLVYTTGLGSNPVRVPLELDARGSGQPVPPGLTVFGNADFFNFPNSFWDINLKLANKPEVIWPDAYSWPLTEAYFDCWILVSTNEYVMENWAPNVLVWGYLSAQR